MMTPFGMLSSKGNEAGPHKVALTPRLRATRALSEQFNPEGEFALQQISPPGAGIGPAAHFDGVVPFQPDN